MAELKKQREEKERKAREEAFDGLCNPASLDIFATWYALGGSQSPPSLSELYQLPAWLLTDIRYIYAIIGDERDEARRKRPKKKKAGKLR